MRESLPDALPVASDIKATINIPANVGKFTALYDFRDTSASCRLQFFATIDDGGPIYNIKVLSGTCKLDTDAATKDPYQVGIVFGHNS